jgi:hypothetical protein
MEFLTSILEWMALGDLFQSDWLVLGVGISGVLIFLGHLLHAASQAKYPLVLHGLGKLYVVSGARQSRLDSNHAESTMSPTESQLRPLVGNGSSDVWSWKDYLAMMCPSFQVPFQPSCFLWNGHLQTIYASFVKPVYPISYVR